MRSPDWALLQRPPFQVQCSLKGASRKVDYFPVFFETGLFQLQAPQEHKLRRAWMRRRVLVTDFSCCSIDTIRLVTTVAAMNSLLGVDMPFVNVRDLHNCRAEILRQAEGNATAFVTRYGKPIAIIRSLAQEDLEDLALLANPELRKGLEDEIFCRDVAWVTTGVSSSPPTSLSSAGRRSERQSSSDSPSG